MSSVSRSHVLQVSSAEPSKLGQLERDLLLLPTIGGLAFGVFPLMLGGAFGAVLSAPGNDSFVYRLAGAASLGYAVMSTLGIRSGAWKEIRLPLIMALVFNGFSFIASVVALFSGEPVLMSVVIGAASLSVTIVGMIAYRRKGKL